MDQKLKELVGRTNLGELLSPSAPEIDLNQPVASAPPPVEPDPIRSTADPFQINFATVDMVGKFQESRTGRGTKAFALAFLGGPMMIFGAGIVYMAWSNPGITPLRAVLASGFGLALAGFWPWIIFANRRQRSRRS